MIKYIDYKGLSIKDIPKSIRINKDGIEMFLNYSRNTLVSTVSLGVIAEN